MSEQPTPTDLGPANPLTDVVPPKARKYVYAAYALAAAVVSALKLAGVDVGPADDIVAAVGIAIGATAASNTPNLLGKA